MKDFKKNAIQIVGEDGYLLENFEEFWDDEDVVLAAVKNQGGAIQFASDRLKSDKLIVLAAVESDPYAIIYANEGLQSDDDILDACEYKED